MPEIASFMGLTNWTILRLLNEIGKENVIAMRAANENNYDKLMSCNDGNQIQYNGHPVGSRSGHQSQTEGRTLIFFERIRSFYPTLRIQLYYSNLRSRAAFAEGNNM